MQIQAAGAGIKTEMQDGKVILKEDENAMVIIHEEGLLKAKKGSLINVHFVREKVHSYFWL